LEILINYFWLIAIIINGVNAVIAWMRSQPFIQKNPELKAGYVKLILSIFLCLTIPWIVMGLGLKSGGVSNLADYFYPCCGNLFILAYWSSILGLIFVYNAWIWFAGGAEILIKHPGILRFNPSNPKTIRLTSLLLLLICTFITVVMFSLQRK
jgi:hypothetical protein